MTSTHPGTRHAATGPDAPQETAPRPRVGRVRFAVLGLLFVGITINYVDRATLSVALPHISEDFHISSTMSGLIMSAFFWTYAFGQMPGGWLADRVGPRVSLFFASLWWGVATALMGIARGTGSLVALRMVLGLGEAPSFPSSAKVVAKWFPKGERSFASATFNNGNAVGGALSIPLVALIVAGIGWRAAFFVAGALGVLWALGWWLYYRDPERHGRLKKPEFDYIKAGQDAADAPEQTTIRWRDLFRFRVMWAMMLGFFCVNFVAYFFITWFPSYLVETYHLSTLKFGFLGMVPGLSSMVGGWCGGLVSDWLVRRGTPVTKARKICLVGGLLGTSVIALAVISPSVGMALTALSVSYFCSTFAAASVWSLPGDVAPTPGHVGSIAGIQNTAGNIAGIVSPLLLGVLMGTNGSFTVPLMTAGCVALIGAATYAFLLPKVQPLRLDTSRSDSMA
ncbi:MFS transporter [Streptomyces sp. NBC_01445]|uniref:MFS transporter n=1 Tax=Streptomyces sp. NBC_01445 TaxID=2903869 RepID=UPI002DD90F06|nr:MFS transporter [Streptomyces sp. NBC_01445]WSE03678.1 MFS transporter [Streptomyces sp. NBC_01445]